ncbi:hypothetical protein P4O66_017969 [Electrophorus voltai]|uniref:Aspartyl beta-hydroxylase/Triadin domain-containing protein n=1 Tax=Electrophorus voltai TaxID=2609070 RepID=A0AAD8YUT7_9TELE|nr:hypothetical protein P4O66_017969 [Electrophorus voltai]
MATKKNARGQSKKEVKQQLASKNGKKPEGSSFFTWFIVLALLGVWTSVAVVYFDLVDYQGVIAKAQDLRYNLSEILQGLTKDGSKENSDSIEEVLDILAEEGSDWFQGFFTFLYDIMSPFETLEDEESEAAAEDVAGTSQTEGVHGQKTYDKPRELSDKREGSHAKDVGLRLREALKQQLAIIHERVEARKIAKMALAEVRSILAKEQEEKALERIKQESEAKAWERAQARLREEGLADKPNVEGPSPPAKEEAPAASDEAPEPESVVEEEIRAVDAEETGQLPPIMGIFCLWRKPFEAVEEDFEAVEDDFEAVEDDFEAVEDDFEAVEDDFEAVWEEPEVVWEEPEAVEEEEVEEEVPEEEPVVVEEEPEVLDEVPVEEVEPVQEQEAIQKATTPEEAFEEADYAELVAPVEETVPVETAASVEETVEEAVYAGEAVIEEAETSEEPDTAVDVAPSEQAALTEEELEASSVEETEEEMVEEAAPAEKAEEDKWPVEEAIELAAPVEENIEEGAPDEEEALEEVTVEAVAEHKEELPEEQVDVPAEEEPLGETEMDTTEDSAEDIQEKEALTGSETTGETGEIDTCITFFLTVFEEQPPPQEETAVEDASDEDEQEEEAIEYFEQDELQDEPTGN